MANAELKKCIVEKIYTNGEFVRMLYLSDYYGQLQEKKGIEKKYTLVWNLKARLVYTYGDDIQI